MEYNHFMFDFHAHAGESTNDAFVTILRERELECKGNYRYFSLGFLPWLDDSFDFARYLSLIENSDLPVGEVGLDRRYNTPGQEMYLWKILSSISPDRLLVIHSVGRNGKVLEMLRKFKMKRAIFHSYASSYEEARRIVDSGYFISLSPISAKTRDFQKLCTLPFLIESDKMTGKDGKDALEKLFSLVQEISKRDIKRELDQMKEVLFS